MITCAQQTAHAQDNIFSRLLQQARNVVLYQWRPLLWTSNLALLAYKLKNQNAKIAATACALAALCYAIKKTPDLTTLEGLVTAAAHNANFKRKLSQAENLNDILFAQSDLHTKMIKLFPFYHHRQKTEESQILENDMDAFTKMDFNKFKQVSEDKSLSAASKHDILE